MSSTNFLEIDLNDLEAELRRQSVLYYEVYEGYVGACKEYDYIKEALQVKEAEVSMAFRLNQKSIGVKVTEKMVEDALMVDKTLQDVRKEKIVVRNKRDLLYGMVKSLEQKRDMLKSLSFSAKSGNIPEPF